MKSSYSFFNELHETDSSFVNLSGGLGNQLFQYCFAQQLQQEIGCPVYLDFSLISLSNKSENSLPSIQSLFGHKLKKVDSVKKASSILAFNSHFFSKKMKMAFLSSLPHVCTELKLHFYKQSGTIFDSSINFYKQSYYFGSFTTHEYWSSAFDTRIQEVNKSLNEYTSAHHQSETSEYDVVVHARRGDYARESKTRRIHGVYGMNYYLDSVSKLSNISGRDIVVLSDDKQFAQQLKMEIQKLFGANSVKLASSKDPLDILARYRHANTFIGCNSTFSWWLAYLGNEKTRFLPLHWFDEGKFGFNPDRYFPLKTNLISFPFDK